MTHSNIAGRLADLCRRARWDDAEAMLTSELATCSDSEARVHMLSAWAGLLEDQRRDPGEAFAWWLRLYMECPDDVRVVRAVERLAESLGAWRMLVDVGEGAVAHEGVLSTEQRAAVLRHAASISRTHLQDDTGAARLEERLAYLVAE